MKRESVLSDQEKESIIIEKLIFHIIIDNELQPIFLDEVILDESQKAFFKNRFIDASQGNQYTFKDKTTSTVYRECLLMKENIDENFLSSSRTLTAQFKEHHKKNMSDGVFVVAYVSILDNRNLLFLIKLDHKLVYRYKRDGATATLEKIKDTFIEDKKAIQKVALIDMSDHYVWDLLASERDYDGIRDYFMGFLGVNLKDDAYSLTEKAKNSARSWSNSNKEMLFENDDPSSYKQRAITYLSSHEIFNSDEFIDYVIYDTDETKRSQAITSYKQHLEEKGIYGQTFKPSKSALTAIRRKNSVKTAEGIIMQWDGEAKDVNMSIPSERNSSDSLFHVIIKTSEIKFIK